MQSGITTSHGENDPTANRNSFRIASLITVPSRAFVRGYGKRTEALHRVMHFNHIEALKYIAQHEDSRFQPTMPAAEHSYGQSVYSNQALPTSRRSQLRAPNTLSGRFLTIEELSSSTVNSRGRGRDHNQFSDCTGVRHKLGRSSSSPLRSSCCSQSESRMIVCNNFQPTLQN